MSSSAHEDAPTPVEDICAEIEILWQAIVCKHTDDLHYAKTSSWKDSVMDEFIELAEKVADAALKARRARVPGGWDRPPKFPPLKESSAQRDANHVFATLTPRDEVVAGVASRTPEGLNYTVIVRDAAVAATGDDNGPSEKLDLDAVPLDRLSSSAKESAGRDDELHLTDGLKIYGLVSPDQKMDDDFNDFLAGIELDETWERHFGMLSSLTYAQHSRVLELAYKRNRKLAFEQGNFWAAYHFRKRFTMYIVFIARERYRRTFDSSLCTSAFTWGLLSEVVESKSLLKLLTENLNSNIEGKLDSAIRIDGDPHHVISHYTHQGLDTLLELLLLFNAVTVWQEKQMPYPDLSRTDAAARLHERITNESPDKLEMDDDTRKRITDDLCCLENMLSPNRTLPFKRSDVEAFFRCFIAFLLVIGRSTYRLPEDAENTEQKSVRLALAMFIGVDLIRALTQCWAWKMFVKDGSLARTMDIMMNGLQGFDYDYDYSENRASAFRFASYPTDMGRKYPLEASNDYPDITEAEASESDIGTIGFVRWMGRLTLPAVTTRLYFNNRDPAVSITSYALCLPEKIEIPNAGRILYDALGGGEPDSNTIEILESRFHHGSHWGITHNVLGGGRLSALAEAFRAKSTTPEHLLLDKFLQCSATISGHAHEETTLLGLLAIVHQDWLPDPTDHVDYKLDETLRKRLRVSRHLLHIPAPPAEIADHHS